MLAAAPRVQSGAGFVTPETSRILQRCLELWSERRWEELTHFLETTGRGSPGEIVSVKMKAPEEDGAEG